MGWWTAFERAEVAADFARIAASGFDSLRLFLTWEDFQPAPERVDPLMTARLVATLDLAAEAGLSVMPTLFTGHMSGVNWLPAWALGGTAGDARFRVVSGGRLARAGLGNWYTDPALVRAQSLLAGELAGALAGHPALWAWDLGNENSNCVVPPTKAHAREWLARISDAIRRADDGALITLGLHMEDLEQDRNLGPGEAASVCDFLTMHGYPGYAAWARGVSDEQLLPFLAQVTRWLGSGKEVVFSEFGVSTYRSGDAESERARSAAGAPLLDEEAAAAYIDRALGALLDCGCGGAMLWCFSDYARTLWERPPFDLAIHERSFGLWRADASPKPAVAVVEAFAKRQAAPSPRALDGVESPAWLDVETSDFQRPPGAQLPRLYRRYCEWLGGKGAQSVPR
jgi:endo-1,4-beta-mannosidase